MDKNVAERKSQKRTVTEIRNEVDRLKAIKDDVPKTGLAGDNHAAIDAQVEVLEGNLFYNAINLKYDGYVLEAAEDAARWRDGARSAVPSEEWLELIPVKAE